MTLALRGGIGGASGPWRGPLADSANPGAPAFRSPMVVGVGWVTMVDSGLVHAIVQSPMR